MMGAIHNQTFTAYAYLVFYGDPAFTLPFSVGRIYQMSFKLDDSKVIPWCMTSTQDVTETMPVKDLPKVFKEWEEGLKSGMLAPFDLPAAERKAQARDTEGFTNTWDEDSMSFIDILVTLRHSIQWR